MAALRNLGQPQEGALHVERGAQDRRGDAGAREALLRSPVPSADLCGRVGTTGHRNLDDEPDAGAASGLDGVALALRQLRLHPRGQEHAAHSGEGAIERTGILEVADRQLDAGTRQVAGAVRGANESAHRSL